MYVGNIPNDDYEHEFTLNNIDGESWLVYVKEPVNGWTSIKIVAIDPVPHKANYWIGWDGERFSRVKDLFSLKENRPKLHDVMLDKAIKYL